MPSKVRLIQLNDTGDNRGASFTLPADILSFLPKIADVHVSTILPGAIRGNHFHTRRLEVILVTYESAWELHWDEGDNSAPQRTEVSGRGLAAIEVEPFASHAIRNTGDRTLLLTAFSSESYDPGESVTRKLV
jgi:dTDP-4-dehydrorhamnose 3,5-epimerase-like enzyme